MPLRFPSTTRPLVAVVATSLAATGAIGALCLIPQAFGYLARKLEIEHEVHRHRAAGWDRFLGVDDAQFGCVKAQVRSQDQEDLRLLPLLIEAATHRGEATFVELGAFDGTTYSNTHMLEKCFGWRGLLIEGNPANFAKLRLHRSSVDNNLANMAICKAGGPGYVNFTATGSAMSGDEGAMSESFKRQHHAQGHTAQVSVPCKPLSAIMRDNRLSSGATFLSLDVEGAEAKVLETIDPSRFHVILVELNGHDPFKDLAVHERLINAGMLPPLASMGGGASGGVNPTGLRVPRSGVYINARNGFLAEYVRVERVATRGVSVHGSAA